MACFSLEILRLQLLDVYVKPGLELMIAKTLQEIDELQRRDPNGYGTMVSYRTRYKQILAVNVALYGEKQAS